MDFLLECIGFAPDHRVEEVVERVLRDGEPAPWRGDPSRHRRLPLGGGVEVRIDREHDGDPWTVLPQFQVEHRLRVAVDEVRRLPDSPFDALLHGWASPPLGADEARLQPGEYRLSVFITDARRLPPRLPFGHVLALSFAGFALDVGHVGPEDGPGLEGIRESAAEAIAPLGAPGDPGGCADVSLRVLRVLHLANPITGHPVDVVEADAPGRPIHLLLSRWQLEKDGLALPQPGWRIEGTFLFSGRIAGGLPGPGRAARASFG